MHFVTGGAFNGKRAWVKQTYRVTTNDVWISAYDNNALPTELIEINRDLLIFEGIEIWLKDLLEKYDVNKVREIWNIFLNQWLVWERTEGSSRHLVVIGTDITKGIVPMETEQRNWRDLTGWVYQDTAAKAARVDIIWYGINQTIK